MTKDERIKICLKCEHALKKKLSASLRCGKCGCFMHLKAAIPAAKCPMNEW